jgi:hypothetical protein
MTTTLPDTGPGVNLDCPACGCPGAMEFAWDHLERCEKCYCRNCGFRPPVLDNYPIEDAPEMMTMQDDVRQLLQDVIGLERSVLAHSTLPVCGSVLMDVARLANLARRLLGIEIDREPEWDRDDTAVIAPEMAVIAPECDLCGAPLNGEANPHKACCDLEHAVADGAVTFR